MNKSKNIKAAFLLVVFSMNTLVGLACSLGFTVSASKIDSHSRIEIPTTEPAATHDHSTSTPAHSHSQATPTHSHAGYVPAHTHEGAAAPHDHGTATPAKDHSAEATPDATTNDCEGDDCCTDDVVKLSLIDKALTSVNIDGITLPQQLEFLLSAFIVSIHTQLSALATVKPPNLRSWPLASHTDLRIVIQSFQI